MPVLCLHDVLLRCPAWLIDRGWLAAAATTTCRPCCLCLVFQAVARRVSYQTFSHVLELDITFHMNRRTGRLSRILERGE